MINVAQTNTTLQEKIESLGYVQTNGQQFRPCPADIAGSLASSLHKHKPTTKTPWFMNVVDR